MSVLVPPMSRPMAFWCPHSAAMCRAAIAPAAMPEAASRTANCSTRAASSRRPSGEGGDLLDSRTRRGVRRGAWCSRRRAAEDCVATAVEKRSCSKISGRISLDVETATSGSLLEDLLHPALVRRVGVRVDEADGDRGHATAPQDSATRRACTSSSGSTTRPVHRHRPRRPPAGRGGGYRVGRRPCRHPRGHPSCRGGSR